MANNPPPKKQGGKKQGGKKQGNKKQNNKPANNNNTNSNNNKNNNNGNTNKNNNKKQGGGGGNAGGNKAAKKLLKSFTKAFAPEVIKAAGANVLQSPNTAPGTEALITQQQQDFIRESLDKNRELEASIAQADNATRVTLGQQNLQGVQAQADATKFASTQQAEATKFSSVQAAEAQKFSATEQARGSIETQRVASESEERQIGLRGKEERETNLQSELFRRFKEAKDQLDALKAFKA